MIEQPALVVAVEGDIALLHTEGQSTCRGCRANTTCGTDLLAKLFPDRERKPLCLPIDHLARRPLPGQRAVLGIDEDYLQRNILLLYVVPLLGLLGGAILGGLSGAGEPVAGNSELASILGGLSGLTAAFFWVSWRSHRTTAHLAHSVRVLRVEPSMRTVAVRDLGLHT